MGQKLTMIKLIRKAKVKKGQSYLTMLIPLSYISTSHSSYSQQRTYQRIMDAETEDRMVDLSRKIFRSGIEAVLPRNLIRNNISRNGDNILISQNHSINLNEFKQVVIVGFGKAVLPMGEELLAILDQRVEKCLLSVPIGTKEPRNPRIECLPGAKNNIPDEASFSSCLRILDITSSLTFPSLIFILISGGGSALFPYPIPPLTMDEKIQIIQQLSKGGATIHEINCVRRSLSKVKGGGYLDYVGNNTGIGFILSDVPGNQLEIIASGPTVQIKESEDVRDPLQIINKYIPKDKIPPNAIKALKSHPTAGFKPNRGSVCNYLIGSNEIALNRAALCASEANLVPVIITLELEGDASTVGRQLAEFCCLIAEHERSGSKKSEIESAGRILKIKVPEMKKLLSSSSNGSNGLCLLFGGETTVVVKGSGLGGRNQELALSASLILASAPNGDEVVILSGGTDGIDGPTDAAGAIATSNTFKNIHEKDPSTFISNNDSYNYFKESKYHLVTGHTETNVMDIIVAIIKPKIKQSNL